MINNQYEYKTKLVTRTDLNREDFLTLCIDSGYRRNNTTASLKIKVEKYSKTDNTTELCKEIDALIDCLKESKAKIENR